MIIKKFKIIVLLGLILISRINYGYSDDYNNGLFVSQMEGNAETEELIKYINLSEEADFWHYSGGYWQTNYYNNSFRLSDEQLIDYIDARRKKFSIDEAIIKFPIPEEFKEYITETGNLEKIRFSLESDYLTSNIRPDEIYDQGEIKYKISDGEIEVSYTPVFNISVKNTIQPTNGTLNVTIPTINPKFGFPLFSIWNKDGTSLGNTNIGNIADVPEGHAFLDGRDSVISIDTSSDIINPQGDLVRKDIGIWNTIPSKYTITQKSTDNHRIGVGTFANGGAAGMKFILPLRMYYPVLEEDIVEEEIIDPVEDIDASSEYSESFEGNGVIKAMSPNSSEFNVSLGIPSSEEVYTQMIGKSRLTNYAFQKVTGNKDFSVTVKRKYIEKWKVIDQEKSTEEETVYINKSSSETVSRNYTVNRDYSYYEIDYFENYGIESATITSDILPNDEVVLLPRNYSQPSIVLSNEVNIVSEPSYDAVVTLSDKIVGKNETPDSPNWSGIAENAVGSYQVRNDSLIFDSDVIMDSSISTVNTLAPKEITEATLINPDVLRKEAIKISNTKRNGTYESTGEILYKKFFDYNGPSSESVMKDVLVNEVKVHTPIYSELLISSIGDNYNQQVEADVNDRAIILGMPTKFRYQTTGSHREILGYGNRDYDQYIFEKEIKFPFDVYYDARSRENSKFVEKNTWITAEALDTDIYVPIWVDEGSYTVQIRSTAINSLGSDLQSASQKNINDDIYIVEDEKKVEVVGRLYGFKVRDINDYPVWEEVFRTATNSYEFIEGNNYPFGGKDENENILRTNEKYFLPLAPGSHPKFSNAGSVPLGYKIRYTVESIGNYSKEDQILIKPSFSFIDYEGNEEKSIKVWSKVKVEAKDYLIDLSSIDEGIKDQIPYTVDLGDPYITLKDEAFLNTSNSLGMSLYDLKKRVEPIGFADEIILTKYLRNYIGDILNKPVAVDESKVMASRQKWYGEYWLPNDTYVLMDDVDLIDYAVENNGIDFNEDIFMKDGYLKVNFKIQTLKDSESFGKNLSYKNDQSNMYHIEGFNNEKEIMIKGLNQSLLFEDGDVIFYDVNRKRSDDYNSFGTH